LITANNSTAGANGNFPFLAVFGALKRIVCISVNSAWIESKHSWIFQANSSAITDRARSAIIYYFDMLPKPGSLVKTSAYLAQIMSGGSEIL
jgi:hypothetical protein